MNIKVGRKYKTRAGDTATITDYTGGFDSWPYKGTVRFNNFSREFGWDSLGRCSTAGAPTSLDLVESIGLPDEEKLGRIFNAIANGYSNPSDRLQKVAALIEEFDNECDC